MHLALCLVLIAGCTVGDDPDDEDLDDAPPDDQGLATFATRFASADTFNHPGLSHSGSHGGIPVTALRTGATLPVYDSLRQVIANAGLDEGPNGNLKISTLEKIQLGGHTMFRLWPGSSRNNGWVDLDDIQTASSLTEEPAARAHNGEACGSAAPGLGNDFVIVPKDAQGTGNPKTIWRIDSSKHQWFTLHPDWDHPGGVNRTFLMWSWTRTQANGLIEPGFSGGGVVRAEMLAGARFEPCSVQPIRSIVREVSKTSSSPKAGSQALAVYAVYGKYQTPTRAYYGWTIIADRLGDSCQMHMACANGPGTCARLPLPASCHY
jgi:hypothetical protein